MWLYCLIIHLSTEYSTSFETQVDVITDTEILDKCITLVNVYSPSYGDKPEFFNNNNGNL